MRLIRIKVEKGITCSTTVVSHWRQNDFTSGSLIHRIFPDTSGSRWSRRKKERKKEGRKIGAGLHGGVSKAKRRCKI